jgi:hypothetical protein
MTKRKRITEKRVREALSAAGGNLWKAALLLDIKSYYYLNYVIKERYPHLQEMVNSERVAHLPDTHPAFRRITPFGLHFMATVSGSCMSGAGLRNGALMEIERTKDAVEGDIVIARVGNQPLVKRLTYAPDGSTILQVENPDYESIPIPKDADFEIFGVVRYWMNWGSAENSESKVA